MIVVKQKPLEEILAAVSGEQRVLFVGCNTCAAVSLAGGEKETETLEGVLRLVASKKGDSVYYKSVVLTRQCEPEYVEQLDTTGFDVIVSLGCGAGVALIAEMTGMPTYPALDTVFIGSALGMAAWRAECSACGQCVLGETAGICPVTRCAKGIMNGPCGGVDDGMCELKDRECAWVLIYERLDAQGRAASADCTLSPKDHAASSSPAWDMTPEEESA